MATVVDKDAFESFFPVVLKDLMDEFDSLHVPITIRDRIQQAIEYNVKVGKHFQSRIITDTVCLLLERSMTPKELSDTCILGWLLAFFRGYLHVFDDIEDRSLTRRGILCWYKVPGVDTDAINDGCMLRSAIFFILKKRFRSHDCYVDMMELFNDSFFITEVGQEIDLLFGKERDPSNWNMRGYNTLSALKCQYAAYYQPFALALYDLKLASPANLGLAQRVLFSLGQFFQVQNDMLDIYGDEKKTGKRGNDIAENKCSWVLIRAMQLVSPEQQKTLGHFWGETTPDAEEKVLEILGTIRDQMMTAYAEEEAILLQAIAREIAGMDEACTLGDAMFTRLIGNMKSHALALA